MACERGAIMTHQTTSFSSYIEIMLEIFGKVLPVNRHQLREQMKAANVSQTQERKREAIAFVVGKR